MTCSRTCFPNGEIHDVQKSLSTTISTTEAIFEGPPAKDNEEQQMRWSVQVSPVTTLRWHEVTCPKPSEIPGRDRRGAPGPGVCRTPPCSPCANVVPWNSRRIYESNDIPYYNFGPFFWNKTSSHGMHHLIKSCGLQCVAMLFSGNMGAARTHPHDACFGCFSLDLEQSEGSSRQIARCISRRGRGGRCLSTGVVLRTLI